MDPVGNIPLFVALLHDLEPARRNRIILRECAIAFAVLLLFVVTGRFLLDLLGLSESSLNIAGGVILFLIALRMIFRGKEPLFGDQIQGEPFIVPLAIPSIAGPTAIATVIVLVSGAPPAGMVRGADGGDRGYARAAAVCRKDQQTRRRARAACI